VGSNVVKPDTQFDKLACLTTLNLLFWRDMSCDRPGTRMEIDLPTIRPGSVF
jgi:hypothetical protein